MAYCSKKYWLALLFDTNLGWENLEKEKKGGAKAGPIKIDPLDEDAIPSPD